MLKQTLTTLLFSSALLASSAMAADYKIDIEGQHAFVNFKVNHLGYSWIYGSFKSFSGNFSYDAAKPEASKVEILINTNSVDTNHAERDKHIRSADFLNVAKYPQAKFVSTSVTAEKDGDLNISGNLTLNGVTKQVVIEADKVGEGKDPWGGYRVGFEGSTTIKLKDFNVKMDLGPNTQEVEFMLSLEGVRQ